MADALLVHLADQPLFRITIPSKIQAYMQAGRPILLGVKGDAAALVQQADCGVVFEPESAQSLVAAVERLVRMESSALRALGENGRRFYQERLCLEHGVGEFERIFHAAASEGREERGRPLLNRRLARGFWRG
jgi:glycosyltransferase involved in cell wall biosynthesis